MICKSCEALWTPRKQNDSGAGVDAGDLGEEFRELLQSKVNKAKEDLSKATTKIDGIIQQKESAIETIRSKGYKVAGTTKYQKLIFEENAFAGQIRRLAEDDVDMIDEKGKVFVPPRDEPKSAAEEPEPAAAESEPAAEVLKHPPQLLTMEYNPFFVNHNFTEC